jgi:hypothetical protein
MEVEMRQIAATYLLATFFLSFCSSAHAQATRTWVSGVGDDANPCSRTAPCKTFAGAISKTLAGGEISVLDPGGYGALTITKSISISDGGAGEAGVLVSGTNGIVVSAGASDLVSLHGLVITGFGGAPSGILFNSAASLNVQNCVIRGFTNGILFAPHAAAGMFVSDTLVNGNTNGILVQTVNAGAAAVDVALNRVQVTNGASGIKFGGTGGTGLFLANVRDSIVANNTGVGIWATSPAGGSNNVTSVDRTAAVNNGTGFESNGALAEIVLNNSVATGDATGVSFSAGANLLSYKNNVITGNTTTNGAPSGTLVPN